MGAGDSDVGGSGYNKTRRQLLGVAVSVLTAAAAPAGDPIAAALDAIAGDGPAFLPSYPTATAPALVQTGFVYDNALAVIALVAGGQVAPACRIADALVIAASQDRFYRDGRLRNAYRAGPVAPAAPPALPGWWDAAAGRWLEDGYQAGTATGNVAWAALALLTATEATGRPAYEATAISLMRWIARNTADADPGFAGGWTGHEPSPVRLGWKSTEHNTDIAAACAWLGRRTAGTAWHGPEMAAKDFVARMWDGDRKRFFIGTGDDGRSINAAPSAIDAELWPLIGIADAPPAWRDVLAWVRGHHAVRGGYGFDGEPDGIWAEGTAQAALVFAAMGDTVEAARLLTVLDTMRAPSGLLYATPDERIGTGLALTPSSKTADFFYFHLPHLGATAWFTLARLGWNPFTGRKLT